jgi:lipopolysaccharide export system permease protein
MRTLRNYLLKELIEPFFLSIVVFTFVLLVGNLIKLADLIISKGVDIVSVSRLFFYLLPYLLSYTIPMATLTACLLGFGRLASDNEITAMRASGISIFRMSAPAIIVSIIISVALIPLNDKLIPKARYISRSILKEIGVKKPVAYLEAGTFIKSFGDYIIFIYAIENNILKNIRIYQPQDDKQTRTIVAEQGEIISIPERHMVRLKLVNGTSDEPDPRNPGNFCKLNFKTYYVNLRANEAFDAGKLDKKPKEMSLAELGAEYKKMRGTGIDLAPIRTEIHKKISLSFAPLVFVLIGIPLAIKTRRGERTIGFGISLAIIIIYWLMLAGTTALSLRGTVPAWLAMWSTNIVLGLAGALLFVLTGERGT